MNRLCVTPVYPVYNTMHENNVQVKSAKNKRKTSSLSFCEILLNEEAKLENRL